MILPIKLFVIEDYLLIEKAKSGDSAAFGELVRRYQIDVRTFLRSRLRDPATADDLAQDVFLGAMKSVERLRQTSSVRSWFVTIARHKLIDFFRSQTRQKELRTNLEEALDIESLRRTQQVEGVDEDLLASLKSCIASLKPNAKNLLEQYYFESVGAKQIAEDVGENPGAVRMMLMRIRRALATCIRKRMGEKFKP